MFKGLKPNTIQIFFIFLFFFRLSECGCAYYIRRFPAYKCESEEPIGTGASAKAYQVTDGDNSFILKVSRRDKKSMQELKVIIFLLF